MDGAGEHTFHIHHGATQPFEPRRIALRRDLSLQFQAEAASQFGGGLPGEGDGGNLVHATQTRTHRFHHALRQALGFSGTRPGLDQKVASKVAADSRSCGGVPKWCVIHTVPTFSMPRRRGSSHRSWKTPPRFPPRDTRGGNRSFGSRSHRRRARTRPRPWPPQSR